MSQADPPQLHELVLAERERLNHFAASVNGWFWECDAELRFSYVSDSVQDVTGREPTWYYGKTREDIGAVPDVDPDEWAEHLATLRRREPFDRFEYPLRAPTGTRWMRVSGAPFLDPAGRFAGYRGVGTEVTGEVLARRTSEQLIAAIDNIGDLIVLWDTDDRLVVCNRPLREQFAAGGLAPPARGTRFADFVRAAVEAGLHPDAEDDPDAWVAWRIGLHRTPGEPFELRSGGGRWWRISEHRLPDGATFTLAVDISEAKRREQELATLASTDELTGLANRREFLVAAEAALDDARRCGRPLALLLLDADHFKRVNDTHGHAAGDEVLRTLARIAVEHTRERDHVGRLGGEEFAAVLPDASEQAALRVAERIRKAAASTVFSAPEEVRVTVSIGAATLGAPDDSIAALLERADEALYRAKDLGRNRVEMASTGR